MRIRHQLRYDAAPEQVYEMLADPAFRERVCAAMETVSHDVVIDRGETGMSVRVDMLQRTSGLPGFARKVVGDRTRVIQSEEWVAAPDPSLGSSLGSSLGADLEVEIPGRPGHIRGTITLTGDGSGTVETFAGEATINVPLVGGRLEGLIEKLFTRGMDTEQRVGAAWLAGEPG